MYYKLCRIGSKHTNDIGIEWGCFIGSQKLYISFFQTRTKIDKVVTCPRFVDEVLTSFKVTYCMEIYDNY